MNPRNTLRLLVVPLAALLLVTPNKSFAEEEPPELVDWKFVASGDTLDEFRVEVQLDAELDQSTPEACVRSFLALADGRYSNQQMFAKIEEHIDQITHNEVRESLKLALVEDLRQPLPAADAAKRGYRPIAEWGWRLESYSKADFFGRGPWESDSIEEGDVQLILKLASKENEPKDDWLARYAFQCRKMVDGEWKISGLRVLSFFPIRSRSERRTPEIRFAKDYDPGFVGLEVDRQSAAFEIPEPARSTENTDELLDVLFDDILLRRRMLRQKLVYRASKAWVEALKPLLHPDWLAELGNRVNAVDLKPYELTQDYSVLESRNDGAELLVQKDDNSKTQWLFTIEETDGSKRIGLVRRRFTAIRVRDNKNIEWFRDVDSVWALSNEREKSCYWLRPYLPVFDS